MNFLLTTYYTLPDIATKKTTINIFNTYILSKTRLDIVLVSF